MIIKSFELKKIELQNINLILLYGKNNGLKKDITDQLINKTDKILYYEEREILEKQNIFFESLMNKSLFDEKNTIIIKRATDKIVKTIEEINQKKIGDLIIILSDNLEKKSKLRSLFEKNKNFICVAFYTDTQEALSKIAYNFLIENNIKISQSNLNLIVNKCNGDRGVLKNELNKIQLYLKNKKTLALDELMKLTNLIENHSISELVDNCLAKNKNKTLLMLNENILSIEDCVIITRTFLQKIKRILNLVKVYQKNKNLDLTISSAKPPIFWKDKEIIKQQINKWKLADISKLLRNVNQIELLIKKNKTDPINIVRNFIIETISLPINSKF